MEGEHHGALNGDTQCLHDEIEYWKSELGRRPDPGEVCILLLCIVCPLNARQVAVLEEKLKRSKQRRRESVLPPSPSLPATQALTSHRSRPYNRRWSICARNWKEQSLRGERNRPSKRRWSGFVPPPSAIVTVNPLARRRSTNFATTLTKER